MNTLSIEMLPMELCFESAQRKNPDFKTQAETAILRHLDAAGPTPGETLTEIARAYAPCSDGRAFGAIFKSLSKRGLIKCLRADLPRMHGRGTSGGKLWARGDAA